MFALFFSGLVLSKPHYPSSSQPNEHLYTSSSKWVTGGHCLTQGCSSQRDAWEQHCNPVTTGSKDKAPGAESTTFKVSLHPNNATPAPDDILNLHQRSARPCWSQIIILTSTGGPSYLSRFSASLFTREKFRVHSAHFFLIDKTCNKSH